MDGIKFYNEVVLRKVNFYSTRFFSGYLRKRHHLPYYLYVFRSLVLPK